MPYASGTAKSADELRSAIKGFATRTLGTYDDLFEGGLGLSSFGTSNYSVLGLRHRNSQAVYLFDVVVGNSMYNASTEHVLLGQLLTTVQGAATIDFDAYIDGEGATVSSPGVTCTLAWTISSAATTLEPAVYAFTATMTGGDIGALSTLENGQAIVLKAGNVRHIMEIFTLSNDEGSGTYTQTASAYYRGSYNVSSKDNSVASPGSFTAPAASSGDQDDFLTTSFSAIGRDLLTNTEFGAFSTNMWAQTLSSTQIAQGWYPRSGRLNFTSGVNYDFFGDTTTGNDYMHMHLQTEGANKGSHWWMGRTSGEAPFLTTSTNASGMFLGTSGPYTDAQGVDEYQYPFSYQAANEAYRNPCVVITPITDDGANSTIQHQSGGRGGYGPTGTNHINKYGPNETVYQFLSSTQYSIQTGFNSFEGGEALGMMGARGRTYYPLRPKPTGTLAVFNPNHNRHYISPWSPVETVLYTSPMPADVTQTDPHRTPTQIAAAPTHTGTLALNADGWAEWAPGTSADPQIHFWDDDATSFSYTAQSDNDYDRIEFRCRLKTAATGGTANSGGEVFFAVGGGSFNADKRIAFAHPTSFTNGEWTTFSINPDSHALWTGTITALRIDLLSYSSAPSSGAVIEWDYVAVGETQLARNARYSVTGGAYALYLGQIPGVNRLTLNYPFAGGAIDTNSLVTLESGTYQTFPAVRLGTSGDKQRPLDPTVNSGIAGYVYKR